MRWDEKGESSARARLDNFIHVPAFLRHMEINASKLEPFRWVVARSTATPIVINLPDDSWLRAGRPAAGTFCRRCERG
jgi:uncharacterized RmlC-like cupin family protein